VDSKIRQLERQAAAGDPEAAQTLARHRLRHRSLVQIKQDDEHKELIAITKHMTEVVKQMHQNAQQDQNDLNAATYRAVMAIIIMLPTLVLQILRTLVK